MGGSAGPAHPSAQARALVIAGALRPADELVGLLGEARAGAVSRELVLRAVRWAGEVAPGGVQVVYETAEARSELAGLLEGDVTLLQAAPDGGGPGESDTARLADASAHVLKDGPGAHVLKEGPGPLLIIWPCLADWRADHAGGALDDLADGCDVSVGPVFDGGFYLLALARPLPELFSSAALDWSGPDALGAAFAAAQEAGLTVGMLRAERGLRNPEDVHAALADPLTDPELAALLAST